MDHKHKIEIVKNDFSKNSGTKGVIYLDVHDRGTGNTNPVIIAHNSFTRNGGYIDGSAVYIRARGRSGINVYSTTPLDGSLFCVNYHFISNTFTENYVCPQYGGSLIRMECIELTDSSINKNDRITYSTFSSTT